MKLSISLLIFCSLFEMPLPQAYSINQNLKLTKSVTDTSFPTLKNVNIKYMLRGYFFAVSSIEDNEAPGGFGGSDNEPKQITSGLVFLENSGLQLIIDTTRYIRLAGDYEGQKVYLINTTGQIISFEASDSRLKIIAEIYFENSWQPIEYLPSSWCGNSYHTLYLKNNEYWEFDVPRYTGKLKVKLRYRLEAKNKRVYYSNEINASINRKQLYKKEGHTPQGIMDPYND